jgi:hypothetical protein
LCDFVGVGTTEGELGENSGFGEIDQEKEEEQRVSVKGEEKRGD